MHFCRNLGQHNLQGGSVLFEGNAWLGGDLLQASHKPFLASVLQLSKSPRPFGGFGRVVLCCLEHDGRKDIFSAVLTFPEIGWDDHQHLGRESRQPREIQGAMNMTNLSLLKRLVRLQAQVVLSLGSPDCFLGLSFLVGE